MKMTIELLTASLKLPFTEENLLVFEECVNIYKTLFGISNVKGLNVSIKETFSRPQWLYQRTITSLSLLFGVSINGLNKKNKHKVEIVVDKYIELCKEAIGIYNTMAQNFGGLFTKETWNILFRVLIGIFDYVMREEAEKSSEKLRALITESVILAFIQSGSRDMDPLEKYFANWAIHPEVLTCWYNLCSGLTTKLVYLLFGVAYETLPLPQIEHNDNICFNEYLVINNKSTIKLIEIKNDYVVYLWYKFVTLLERNNPSKLIAVHSLYKDYLRRVLNILCSIQRSNKELILILNKETNLIKVISVEDEELNKRLNGLVKDMSNLITGNSIMKFFGKRIFKDVLLDLTLSLCTFPALYSYLNLYLITQNISKLIKGIKNEKNLPMIITVLKNSKRIFTGDLNVIHEFIPLYLELIGFLIHKHKISNEIITIAINIVSPITEILYNTPILKEVTKSTEEEKSSRLNALNKIMTNQEMSDGILQLLLDSYNFKVLSADIYAFLWISCVIIINTKDTLGRIAFIDDVLNKVFVEHFAVDLNEYKIIFTILDITEIILESIIVMDEVIRNKVENLLREMLVKIEENIRDEGKYVKVVKSKMKCCYEGLIIAYLRLCLRIESLINPINDINSLTKLQNIIEKCKKYQEDKRITAINFKSISKAAKYVMDAIFLNNEKLQITNINPSIGWTVFEGNLLFDLNQSRANFLVNNRLITLIDLPIENERCNLLIVIRSSEGTIAYKGEMLTSSTENTKEAKGVSKVYSDNAINDIIQLETDEIEDKELLDIIKREIENEKEYLKSKEEDKKIFEFIDKNLKDEKLNKSSVKRDFLQQLQYLAEPSLGILKEDKEFIEHIKKLDNVLLKEVIQVPLLYIDNPDAETYRTNYTDNTYFQQFLSSLGLVLNHQHILTGHFNYLKEYIDNIGMVYAGGYFANIVFLCPSLRFVRSSISLESTKMFILWNERSLNPYDIRLPSYLYKVRENTKRIGIILTPMKNELFRINVLVISKGEVTPGIVFSYNSNVCLYSFV